MGCIPDSVHPRVCPSCTCDGYFFAQQGGECGFEDALYALGVRLNLPAVKGGSAV